MAVYSRTTTTTQQTSSPIMPSVDLGSIIVRSLENSLQGLESGNSDLSTSITEGINNSVLGQEKNSQRPQTDTASKKAQSGIDALIKEETNLYKQKKKNQTQEEKDRKNLFKTISKGYADLFKNLKSNLEGTFEKSLSAMSTFTNNPLEGLDKGIQAIMKGSLGTIDKIMNTEIKIPGKSGENQKDKERLQPVTTIINEKSSQIEEQLKQLIDVDKSGNEKINSNLVALQNRSKENERKRSGDETKKAKEGAIKEKKRSQDAANISAGIGVTNLVLGNIGQIVTMVGLAFLAGFIGIPILVGAISEGILRVKEAFTKLIDVTLPMLWEKLKTWVQLGIQKLMNAAKIMLQPIIMKIQEIAININPFKSKEEKQKELAQAAGMSAEEYEFYSSNRGAIDALNERKKLQETYEAQQKVAQARKAEFDNYLKEHGVKDIKELGAGNIIGIGKTKEYKEAEALKESYEKALKEYGNTLHASQFKGQEVVEVNGKKVKVHDLQTKAEYADIRKQFEATGDTLSGKSEAYKKQLQDEYEIAEAEAKTNLAQRESELNLSHFQNRAYAADLQSAIESGTYKQHFGKEEYTLTDEQRAKLKEQLARGEYQQLGSLEKNAAIKTSMMNQIYNTAGRFEADVFKSTSKDAFQEKDISHVDVGGTPIHITQTVNDMKVEYGSKALGSKK